MVKNWWNSLLDKTVYFSFDRSGFDRHSREFSPIDYSKISGATLVTGGSDGIGRAVVNSLIENKKTVTVIGRDQKKLSEIPANTFQLDLANYDDIKRVANKSNTFNNLVFNAGGMPEQLKFNNYQHEYQLSSQLIGHLILFKYLLIQNKIQEGGRIIFTSSGGMLLKQLNVDDLKNPQQYDKVQVYANVKRAQVIMVEELSKKYPQFTWSSMHPGWVETRAVKEALPGFYQFTKNRLRSPNEGADTILWLLSQQSTSNGKFWFDREIAQQYPFKKYRETQIERKKLLNFIDSFLGEFNF